MDEEDLDLLIGGRPFGTADAMLLDVQARRCTALGIALWGTTSAGLQRQLLEPYPEIPSGFDLADFRRLHRSAHTISTSSWLTHVARSSAIIFVGSQSFSEWEARCEIVRRAIEYLERR